MLKKLIIASSIALALTACQSTPQIKPQASPAIDQAIKAGGMAFAQTLRELAKNNPVNPVTYADVAYDNASERQKLDIYLPKNAVKPVPTVIHIHGGGWVAGDKAEVAGGSPMGLDKMMTQLLANGYAVVSVEYRFAPDVLMQDIVGDATKAFEFIRKNGKQYGLDTTRLAVMGESAGGHLAQWLAVTQGQHIKASLPYYAPADFVNLTNANKTLAQCQSFSWADIVQSAGAKNVPNDWDLPSYVVGETNGSQAFIQKAKAFSPLYQVSKNTPLTLMFHGTNDCVVAHEQSVRYLKKLQEYQIPSELVIVEGEGHATPKFWTTPAYQEKVLAFLKQYL